ncbi:hypothetical protein PVK06_047085 [Gossypium arboreum]|uniref:Uncharacterized protein n=1 Tax=Gossypium arboreum TaxID=29729 RepID=A0ABR0MCD0_GOSAR|nr:hypothetical protein PVK06_047085 [Gossypium arboreum]
MGRALDLQPSLEDIQWYSKMGKPFFLWAVDGSPLAHDTTWTTLPSPSTSASYTRAKYSTSPGPSLLQYSTPPGSSSSMAFDAYNFSSMFCTPLCAGEENVDRRNHPQPERRPSQKYTPRTTPSIHQF